MNAKTQIIAAAVLGTKAFHNGIKCAPYRDKELMELLKGRMIGQTPEGEAGTVRLLAVWTENWKMAQENEKEGTL
jgi:hypothetical protein